MKRLEDPREQISQVPSNDLESPERRALIKGIVALSAAAAASPVLLVTNEAKANVTLTEDPNTYGGYPTMINRFRRAFGRRQDYQQGFVGAANQSNRIFELPAGAYGILVENNMSNAVDPMSTFPVDRAGYLHATQEVKDSWRDIRGRWMKAEGELNEKIRKIILKEYREYGEVQGMFGSLDLLDKITAPVVTLHNWRANQLEMFLRVPTPGTREFFQMAMGERVDYYDQAKTRSEHTFDTMYDSSKSLFDNLTVIYGPQLLAFQRASQQVKNGVATSIGFINQQIENQFGRRYALTASQKNSLNSWLNVAGTAFEIR